MKRCVCTFLVGQESAVGAAQDLVEALGILHRLDGRIDLLFTDVNMPGERDGFDLARQASGY